jgi:hypothetical protein
VVGTAYVDSDAGRSGTVGWSCGGLEFVVLDADGRIRIDYQFIEG